MTAACDCPWDCDCTPGVAPSRADVRRGETPRDPAPASEAEGERPGDPSSGVAFFSPMAAAKAFSVLMQYGWRMSRQEFDSQTREWTLVFLQPHPGGVGRRVVRTAASMLQLDMELDRL